MIKQCFPCSISQRMLPWMNYECRAVFCLCWISPVFYCLFMSSYVLEASSGRFFFFFESVLWMCQNTYKIECSGDGLGMFPSAPLHHSLTHLLPWTWILKITMWLMFTEKQVLCMYSHVFKRLWWRCGWIMNMSV